MTEKHSAKWNENWLLETMLAAKGSERGQLAKRFSGKSTQQQRTLQKIEGGHQHWLSSSFLFPKPPSYT